MVGRTRLVVKAHSAAVGSKPAADVPVGAKIEKVDSKEYSAESSLIEPRILESGKAALKGEDVKSYIRG